VARWLAKADWAVPARPSPGARAASTLESRLPGLDAAGATRALGGSRELYRQVLQRFAHDQAASVERLGRFRRDGRHVDALRLTHTLKGLAGTIGAARLRLAAMTYEEALRVAGEGDWPDIHDLERELTSVLDTIAAAGV
jgi:HPt (histidine-containing phosphotransfer) domain-containing protein